MSSPMGAFPWTARGKESSDQAVVVEVAFRVAVGLFAAFKARGNWRCVERALRVLLPRLSKDFSS